MTATLVLKLYCVTLLTNRVKYRATSVAKDTILWPLADIIQMQRFPLLQVIGFGITKMPLALPTPMPTAMGTLMPLPTPTPMDLHVSWVFRPTSLHDLISFLFLFFFIASYGRWLIFYRCKDFQTCRLSCVQPTLWSHGSLQGQFSIVDLQCEYSEYSHGHFSTENFNRSPF